LAYALLVPASASPPRPPRRLSREARREQLVEAALPIIAAQGFTDFSLDEVAAKADVTRNLLYHYFPRGRADLVLAVAERAGHELTDGWIVDETIPLETRLATNIGRAVEHAREPTDAWRIYRLAQTSPGEELAETVDRFVDAVVASIALNQIGTPDPPPVVRLALRGFVAFFATVLDEARATSTPLEELLGMLNSTLVAVVESARATSR
jgi:AcrR family transcriptional regulator